MHFLYDRRAVTVTHAGSDLHSPM